MSEIEHKAEKLVDVVKMHQGHGCCKDHSCRECVFEGDCSVMRAYTALKEALR